MMHVCKIYIDFSILTLLCLWTAETRDGVAISREAIYNTIVNTIQRKQIRIIATDTSLGE